MAPTVIASARVRMVVRAIQSTVDASVLQVSLATSAKTDAHQVKFRN